MKNHRAWAIGFVLAVLLAWQAAPRALAQDQAPQPPDQAGSYQAGPDDDQPPAQDPPGRVAQLAYSNGSVSFQPGGQGDWVQAVNNRPLTSGDNLWSDKDSRAELRIGSSTLRMDSETSVTFLDLDDQSTQIKLSMGTLIVRVKHLDDGDLFEVDTPNLAFNIQRTGEYRFDVNADGTETDTTVWQGSGEATGGGASFLVVAGQRARFSGSDQLDHEIEQLPGSDDFDNWSSNRDQDQDRSDSGNYVSEEVTGYQDLDQYGSWSNVAGYGACWTPSGIAVDWAPYRMGHWVWIAPWGWTWVDDEPWGFAPFHYGRWAFVSSRWYWVPGRAFVRPVYAPALVAFVGGAGFAVGVGGPGVAWFPLGPGEVYVPWYRTSRVYVNNVNITNARVNVTQVTNVYNTYRSRSDTRITYVNQHSYGVTAVSRDTFVNARPVARSIVHVDERQIAAAPGAYRPAEQPSHTSMMGAGAPARFRPPVAVTNREVIATRVPRGPQFESRPAANVHAETPAMAQPAGRPNAPQAPANAASPSNPRYQAERPVPRPQDNVQPQPPAQQQQQQTPQSVTRPDMGMRNDGQYNQQRPNSGMGQPAPRPAGPQMNEVPNRPLVRSAPPVQNRPDVQQSEQQKFSTWQQQRQNQNQGQQQAPQSQMRRPENSPQQPRSEPSKPAPQSHDDNKHK